MKKKNSLTWQIDSMQCGAACLHMICKYWGKEMKYNEKLTIKMSVETG